MKTLIIAFSILLTFSSKAQYTITTPVTGLISPVAFKMASDGRFFITLKSGTIKVYANNGTFLSDFYNLTDSTNSDFERGLLGIELDPDFQNNHYVYAYYNHVYPAGADPEFLRVVRFTESNNVGSNPLVILSIPVSNTINGNHVGGNLRFRPSQPDQIYVSIGEIAIPAYAQALTNPFGKILRINKNGTIPSTNPFYDDGNPSTGNDDRIWSWGHRNPFDFTFGPNDSLYSTENGANAWDEVNIVSKGKNYGWRNCEGNYVYGSGTTLCQSSYPTHIEPIFTFGSPLPAVTGILYYSGTVMPEFNNHLLVADNDRGYITNLTLQAPAYATVSANSLFQDLDPLTTLMQGPEGCIYAMKGGYTTTGNIRRICPSSLGVNDAESNLYALESIPNPFSQSTQVKYSLKQKAHVKMTLYDPAGRIVSELMDEEKPEGSHVTNIKASDYQLREGAYFCRLQLDKGQFVKTIKLVVLP